MDEVVLASREPTLVSPTKVTVIHNTMTSDDPLLVSSHGDLNKKWMEVLSDNYLKFNTDIYLLQSTRGQVVLPAFEIEEG